MEILELKSIMSKMKNLVEGLLSRCEIVEERTVNLKVDQQRLSNLKSRKRKKRDEE